MAYTNVPQLADLTAKLTEANIARPSDESQQAALDNAVAAFEEQTGRRPMLAGSSADWRYDPPRGRTLALPLRRDFVAISAVKINGSTLVEGQDYWLEPYDAPEEGLPYNLVRFSILWWPMAWQVQMAQWKQSIVITGQAGYASTLKADAWNAMLYMAAIECRALQYESSIGALKQTSIGQGDLVEQYADVTGGVVTEWQRRINDTINRYTRTIY